MPVIHCPDQSQTGVTTASHWLTRLPPLGPPTLPFIHSHSAPGFFPAAGPHARAL